ncbi:hypothetical protein [Novosphingobium sp. FSW06-99]|uniref:hypothetical protein n=1 Tax=Novosphingobium sp. FSW06-99 TaxID=1739113 RepID=UPI00076BF950|nr:hypothetical protein [Novosphingobium sp. FSW06-99]KUR74715.1 hypothetical protein AQZ49_17675 [Novosphingobium sp. FSW06-99]
MRVLHKGLGWLALLTAALLSMPVYAQTSAAPADTCQPSADSIQSRAGQEWTVLFGWRFANPADGVAAYRKLVAGMSPWADWDPPVAQTLAIGTRFAMAMAPDQPATSPGGFGTFDHIAAVRDVREDLAVRADWKPKVDHVVIFEVVRPLPVLVGPIGPQVDPTVCEILPGRWSQFQMQVAPADRASYLKVVTSYTIQ